MPSALVSSFLRRIVAATSVLAAIGCGGNDAPPADSANAAGEPIASQQAPAPSVATEATSPPSIDAIPGAAAPITGAIVEVRMIGDAKGYRFEPQQVTAKPGDGVRFVVVSGGPHEVAFDLDAVPAESRNQLQVNMPNSASGRSPLLAGAQETWTLSLGALAPGTYPFVSTPRLAQGMKGEIIIR